MGKDCSIYCVFFSRNGPMAYMASETTLRNKLSAPHVVPRYHSNSVTRMIFSRHQGCFQHIWGCMGSIKSASRKKTRDHKWGSLGMSKNWCYPGMDAPTDGGHSSCYPLDEHLDSLDCQPL